jgi:hypothetical protein
LVVAVHAGDLGRHVRLVHRLVRQHRLADDVADRKDVRHVGAHLYIHRDEAPVGDRDAGLLGGDLPAIGGAAHGLQHQVVECLRWCVPSFRPRT